MFARSLKLTPMGLLPPPQSLCGQMQSPGSRKRFPRPLSDPTSGFQKGEVALATKEIQAGNPCYTRGRILTLTLYILPHDNARMEMRGSHNGNIAPLY
jgi:hypothetical protein